MKSVCKDSGKRHTNNIDREENLQGVSTRMSDKPVKRLPMLPLRGLTIFPYMVLHFDVGRSRSIAALEEAMINNQEIFLVTQKDIKIDDPEIDDIYEVGTIAKIKQLLKLPGETIRVLVEGLERGKILEYTKEEPFFEVVLATPKRYDKAELELQLEAVSRNVLSSFEDYVKLSNKISPETLLSVNNLDDPERLADIIAANVLVRTEDKQKVLEAFHPD
jgi:ATP-dependent Lon protease